MDKIIKKINNLGYNVDMVNNIIVISKKTDELAIYINVENDAVYISNFDLKYVTKLNLSLIPLINSLLINRCCIKHIELFKEVK